MNPNETVIPLRSLTHAMKAKILLSEHGIQSKIVKPDARKSEKGCGYGITVERQKADIAGRLLKANGIYPLDVG